VCCGRGEKAIVRAWGAGGGDCEDGVAVYGCHARGLCSPVFQRVLNDAERVDPEVAEAETAGESYRILESFREVVEGDSV